MPRRRRSAGSSRCSSCSSGWAAPAPLSALGAGLTDLQENDIAAFLPDSAESTRVQELQAEFQPVESIPAVLLWENPDGIDEATLADDRRAAAGGRRRRRGRRRARRRPASPPIPSEDGEAVQAFLPLEPDLATTCSPWSRTSARRSSVDGTDSFVTGPGRHLRRLLQRLRGHRRPAAAGRVRRRPADPAGRLPQPAAAAAGHRHRRPGADRGQRGGLPAGRRRRHHRQRPEPGHRGDPGRRRGHRLRPAPGRPVPRGTAPRAVEVHRDADRAPPVVGADRRLRRHRRPRRPLPAALRPRLQPRARADLGGERHPRRRSPRSPSCPAALVLLGRAAFWPFRPQYGAEPKHGRGWDARRRARRPPSPAGARR